MSELDALKDGDATAWRRAVDELSPRLNAFARRLCGDPDLAEDIVQETWILAFRKRGSMNQSTTLLGWLFAISRSVFLSNERVLARRSSLLEVYVDDEPTVEQPETSDARLATGIATLSERQRDVLLLRLADGLSTRETAVRLGIAEGTVKATLHRALQIMRENMIGESP